MPDATMLDSSVETNVARSQIVVEEDAAGWRMRVSDAREALGHRRAFRAYLERCGVPDVAARSAELVFAELTANCVRHAPGALRIRFAWRDRTLAVTDAHDRLRSWPFSESDGREEITHHSFALIRGLAEAVHVARDPSGGTRATIVLPLA